jgi:quercetin dioxygenase-like cupin family protein
MKTLPALPAETTGRLSLIDDTAFRDHAIVSRTLLQTPQLRVVLFHFDAGQELTEHTSPHRATVQVLSGGCEFLLGTEWHLLKTGDFVHMSPGLPHAVRAAERFSMLLTLAPVAVSPKNEAAKPISVDTTRGIPAHQS